MSNVSVKCCASFRHHPSRIEYWYPRSNPSGQSRRGGLLELPNSQQPRPEFLWAKAKLFFLTKTSRNWSVFGKLGSRARNQACSTVMNQYRWQLKTEQMFNIPLTSRALTNCVVVIIGSHHFVVSFWGKKTGDPVGESGFQVERHCQPVWLVVLKIHIVIVDNLKE